MRVPKLSDQKFCAGVTWESKKGSLTPSGERQMYIAGQEAQDRYVKRFDFLNSDYDSTKILVISTQADRSIMSA